MFEDRVLVPPHRITRVPTYQGHYVPDHAYYPSLKFDPDIAVDIENPDDPDEYPYGATAQNDMREVRFYQCGNCAAVVRENDIDTHRCEATDGPQG